MNNEKSELKKLHDLLNAPKAPEDLADKLKANLKKQVFEEEKLNSKSLWHKKLIFATAASIALAIVVIFQFSTEPKLISLAYVHAQEEAGIEGAIDGGYQAWFEKAGLQLPVESSAITLSKNCAIGKQQAKHLRFDLPDKGTINLFVYQDDTKAASKLVSDGTIDGQSWISLVTQDDTHVVALFDAKVSDAKVNQIIQSMFKNESA